MKPVSLAGGRITLWRGDCQKVLPKLDEFDAAIFDPPYEASMHNAKSPNNQRNAARGIRTDGYAVSKHVDFVSIGDMRPKITPLIGEKCRGWFLAFCTPEGIAPWRDAIEAAGIRYKRACFWEKTDAAPQFNGQGPAFAVEPFVAAWCGRGVSRWNGGGRRNIWKHPTQPFDRQGDHPTEKPLGLMIQLIELFTKPGDIVCDPFMGSGATMLACLATGRRGIGIEMDAKYFKLARARIDTIKMGAVEAAQYDAWGDIKITNLSTGMPRY